MRLQSIWMTSILLLASLAGSTQWENRVNEIIQHPDLVHTQLGISIVDEKGRVLFNHDGDRPFIPASTYKLVPSLIALDVLGESHRFETVVAYSGEILEGGLLYGDVIVIGGGDPSLGFDREDGTLDLDELTMEWVEVIRRAGITCIDGKVVVDASLFDPQGVHRSWTWDDLSNYYACGAYGFNIHENLFYVDFSRTRVQGVSTSIAAVRPHIPGLRINNKVITGRPGSGDNAYIYGSPEGYDKEIRGTIPPGNGTFTIKGAIPDPAAFYAFYFAHRLQESGVLTGGHEGRYGSESQIDTDDLVTLHITRSPALGSMIKTALFESHNLYVDVVMKTLGLNRSDHSDFEGGVAFCAKYLSQAGISLEAMSMNDGSGLSWKNRIAPAQLNAFLRLMNDRLGREAIDATLPTPGEGSLSSLLREFDKRDKYRLKSGSLGGVLGYSGYFDLDNGQRIFITVFSNGHVNGNGRIRRQFERIFIECYQGLNR